MSKLESNETAGIEKGKSSKSNLLKQTMRNIANTFSGKKPEEKSVDHLLSMKKLDLANGKDYNQTDLSIFFNLNSGKKVSPYLSLLKGEGIPLEELMTDLDGAIIVETEDGVKYTFEHKTTSPNGTLECDLKKRDKASRDNHIKNLKRKKLFNVTQSENNKDKEIGGNCAISMSYGADGKLCLKRGVIGYGGKEISIKSLSQKSNNNRKTEKTEKPENKIVSDIEDRLTQSKNKKVCDRTKLYLNICKGNTSEQMTEMYLAEKQVDILNLAEGTADDGLSDRYPGRKKEDFQELYDILYGEER